MPERLLGPDIQELISGKRLKELREALVVIPPYDIAESLSDLPEDQHAIVFRILPRALATDVFEKLSFDEQEDLLASLGQEQIRQIIEEMDPDDRTALLEELPARVTRKLLRLLSVEERQVAQSLLAYPENSVGRLMTPDHIDLQVDMTIAQALELIRHVAMDKETVYVCYVTRPGHILAGVVGLRRLVIAEPDTLVGDLMREPDAFLDTHEDQEEAVRALRDYDLLALPIVDSEKRLLGIVTVDDVLDVVEEEATEDMQVMAGVLPETERSYLEQRILGISWRRGAPLLCLVIGGFVAALVLTKFKAQLDSLVALAFFMPLVMATGGSTGVQTATLIVRGLSTGEVHLRDFWRILRRELSVCLILAIVLGLFAMTLSFAMISQYPESFQSAGYGIEETHIPDAGPEEGVEDSFKIGVTIAISLFLVMFLSVVAGVLMPMLFELFKLDPAIMTSPFLTTTVDVLGLLIYFLVASRILNLS